MLRMLGELPIEEFLALYWQQKPLLIRQLSKQPLPDIDANEMAGLALQPGIESRIVYRQLNGLAWQVEHGPFAEQHFSKLPETDWTLLIQGLDHWLPECADLLNQFRFVPNWRLDDIMASFAVAGGSVGPHCDQYDVFLLQAKGQRKWQIGPECSDNDELLPNTPLNILKHMEVTDEWILQPGDCLYLPAGISHYGVALEDCITLSIGFRSPGYNELLSSLADRWCEAWENTRRLQENHEKLQENPGEISSRILNTLQHTLVAQLSDPVELASWFGEFITLPKHEGIVIPLAADELVTEDQLATLLANPLAIWRWNDGSRFTYSIPDQNTANQSSGQSIVFSVDGESYVLPWNFINWVKLLCLNNTVDSAQLRQLTLGNGANTILLTELINNGSLTVAVPHS